MTKKNENSSLEKSLKSSNFDVKQLSSFIGDVKSELKKITWATQEELNVYTKIVIGATFFIGLSIYFSDIGIQTILKVLGFFFGSY